MSYVNQATYVGATKEVNTSPSVTIPGQTLSLRQLLDRYVRGQSVEVFEPVYDDTMPEGIEHMDKFDRLDMAREIKTAIKRHQEKPAPQPPVPEPPAPAPAPDPPAPSPS